MTDAESDPKAQRDELEGLIGRTIGGKYKVLGLLGRGGMGAVFEAEHATIGRKVAIKFVDREFAKDDRVVSRFAREARAASAIESDHIVSVFDAGTDDGHPYIVMELLRGEDVGSRLRRLRRLPLDQSLHILAQMLRGLGRAHAAGIVHRDLKPDNILLVERDHDPLFVKIVDFGISKMQRLGNKTPFSITAKGVVLGTPLFMSPEQAQALPDVDERSDLYSAGAILFECLAGRPPHVGETEEQIILSICTTDAPDIRTYASEVPEAVARFLAKALRRDRATRFQSAAQMLAGLREVAPSEPAAAPIKGLEFSETLRDSSPPFSVEAVGPGGTLALGGGTEGAVAEANVAASAASVERASGGGVPRAGARTDVSWSTGGLRRAGLPKGWGPHLPLVVAAFLATATGVVATVWVATAMRGTSATAGSEGTRSSGLATSTAAAPTSTSTSTSTPTSTSTSTSTSDSTSGGPESRPAKRGVPVATWVLGGAGLAAIGAGVFFWVSGLGDRSDLYAGCGLTHSCAQSDVDASRTKLLIGDVAVGAGIVALGVATYFALAPRRSPSTHAARVDFAPTAGGGFVSMRAPF